MKKLISGFFAATLLFSAVQARAEATDAIICALTKSFACIADEGCREVPVQEMNLPRFVKIDFGTRAITSLDKMVNRPATSFNAIDRLEGTIVLHGLDRRGWSAAIAEDTGAMTLTASGSEEGVVVFGSCIKP